MKLAPLLQIGRGVSALIGSGGKTTLMETLAGELRKKGTVILCTSTHIRVPTRFETVTGDAGEIKTALAKTGAVCAGTPADGGKLTAPPISFEELSTLADYVLVEADGAKGLPLKAHAPYEPVIPANTQRVVLVVGAQGFGKPVREVCHRAERWAALADVTQEVPATPEQAAKVLRAERLGDRIYVNQVESAADYEAAEEMAKRLDCGVVIGSLRQGVYTLWK